MVGPLLYGFKCPRFLMSTIFHSSITQVLLCSLDADDFVTRQATRLLGASSWIAGVSFNPGLDVRQPSSDAAQLYIELVGEVFHLGTAQLVVNHARQKPDDAPPLVILLVHPDYITF